MNIEQAYPRVREIIADVLVTDTDAVALNKRLIADLGAESIDFLDLVFQLEREFAIKIPRGQLEKSARGDLTNEEFEQGGVITAKGMEVLKHYFSEVPAEFFKANMKVNEIPMLFTVETFCKIVVEGVKQKAAVVS